MVVTRNGKLTNIGHMFPTRDINITKSIKHSIWVHYSIQFKIFDSNALPNQLAVSYDTFFFIGLNLIN